ncbi:hypothetical protein Syun_017328 [Stephania yunnanensis]|uniref:Uncharacterized protein n=1 Tax=Stephania yunnanensis TaxID=152371 RepID=A0AAP0P5Q8_9MAGN
MRVGASNRDKSMYCRGHNTKDCRKLKEEIEFQDRKGHLNKFAKSNNGGNKDNKNARVEECHTHREFEREKPTMNGGGVIDVISGGARISGGTLSSNELMLENVLPLKKCPKGYTSSKTLFFSDNDLQGVNTTRKM